MSRYTLYLIVDVEKSHLNLDSAIHQIKAHSLSHIMVLPIRASFGKQIFCTMIIEYSDANLPWQPDSN